MTKEAILKEYYGYDSFRPLQAEIIDKVITKKDCLVIMPTGGGKSVCYQVPAMLMQGITVVISPLIALMKDQVQALQGNGIAAAYINSMLSSGQQNEIEQDCLNGKLKILYISPEKLFSTGYIPFLQKLNINLFAIDEAHCISFWGHDFRPEYTQLKIIKEVFPQISVIALTATADRATRKDIMNQLGIDAAEVFISSFDRPNLKLTVAPGRGRLKYIQDFLYKHQNQAGIIYCLARKTTESVADSLRKMGFNAKHYHAKETIDYRSKVQDDFLKDDVQIIVATIAFGMGIDKSNVRWVIHYNLPKNVESFYQEIGRAGRDGMPSDTLLLYSYADVMTQLEMIENSESPDTQKELLRVKLERMRQYAESEICRRRILLSYFNDEVNKDCGNCDVCQNPKQKFDGTILAQKVLSAIARTNQKIAMGILIDILRGSNNRNVLNKGYEQLKTFGVGKDLRSEEWADYIFQMLNSGVMEIAYDEGHTYKLNNRSMRILKGEDKVPLSKFESLAEKKAKEMAEESESRTVDKSKRDLIKGALFERLRALRKTLADERSLPPYVVFSDQTISDMAQNKPKNRVQFLAISGVSQQKYQMYGERFIEVINQFTKEVPDSDKIKIKADGTTYRMTLGMYQDGMDIEDMANARSLSPVTIVAHLIKLRDEGENIDLSKFIKERDRVEVESKARALGVAPNGAIKPLLEAFEERFSSHYLRLILANMKS